MLFDKDVIYNRKSLAPIMWTKLTRVPKKNAKPDQIRWRYLFETARHAFSKMRPDNDAIPNLMKMRKSLPTRIHDKDSNSSVVKPVSAGDYSQAAQKAAIQQTLDGYKRKERDCDTILNYLKCELYGRRIRQQQRDLTEYQHHLVARLVDVADLFVDVYARMVDPDEDLEEGEDSLVEQEAFYMRERDRVIELIQAELDRPITAADTPKPPDSPKPTNPNASADPNEPRDQEVTEKVLEAVKQFQELTGTSFQNAHNILKASFWNVQIAVSRYYDEQNKPQEAQDHPPAVPQGLPAVSNTPSADNLEQLRMIQKFQEITDMDYDDAYSFLEGNSWNLDTASSLFFGEEEAPTKLASTDSETPWEQSDAITTWMQATPSTTVEYDTSLSHRFPATSASTEPASSDDDLSMEQSNAITSFVKMLGVDFEVADDYLSMSNWDYDTAMKTFWADIAATENTGLPSYAANPASKASRYPDQLASQTIAINDKPTNHISVGYESSKRQAVSSPDGHDLVAIMNETEKHNEDLLMIVKTSREALEEMKESVKPPRPDDVSKPEDVNAENTTGTEGNEMHIDIILNTDSAMSEVRSDDADADGSIETKADGVASSASTMLRKMGHRMKKGTKSIKGLFRSKSKADGVSKPWSTAEDDQNTPPGSTEDTKDEGAKANTRIVRSHNGLRIRVDLSGQFASHVDPIIGSPYQQYQAMRRRLQIQYRSQQDATGSSDPQHFDCLQEEDVRGECPGPSCMGEQCPGERDAPPDEPHESDLAMQATMAEILAENDETEAERSPDLELAAAQLARDEEIVRTFQMESDAQMAFDLARGLDQADIHAQAHWIATIRTCETGSGRKSPGNDSVIDISLPCSPSPARSTRALAPSPEEDELVQPVDEMEISPPASPPPAQPTRVLASSLEQGELVELRDDCLQQSDAEAPAKTAIDVLQGKVDKLTTDKKLTTDYDKGSSVLKDNENGALLESEPPRPGALGAEAGEGFEDGWGDKDAEMDIDHDAEGEPDDEDDGKNNKDTVGDPDGDKLMDLGVMAGIYEPEEPMFQMDEFDQDAEPVDENRILKVDEEEEPAKQVEKEQQILKVDEEDGSGSPMWDMDNP
jgi:hypothetical protein